MSPSTKSQVTSYVGTVTVTSPLADSYVTRADQEAGAVARCCFLQAGEVCEHRCPVSISLNPLQLKLWVSSTLQLVTSWTTLVGGWVSTLVRLERLASCISSCWLLQRGLGRVTEIHHRQAATSYECCCPCHLQHTEVRQRLVSSAAWRAALARRHRPGALQVGSTGIPFASWDRSTVPDKPPHVGVRGHWTSVPAICCSTETDRSTVPSEDVWLSGVGWQVHQSGMHHRTIWEIQSSLWTFSGDIWDLLLHVILDVSHVQRIRDFLVMRYINVRFTYLIRPTY